LILLVSINKVTRKAARHALQLLENAKVKVWGMVVRGVRPDNDGYYYAYYHRYYGQVERDNKKQKRADKKGADKKSASAVVAQAAPEGAEVMLDLNQIKKG
jgi:hypothetical protein